jgi:hypothetical protein
MGVQKGLAEVGFVAQLALEGPRANALMLPLMIQQVALCDESLAALSALVRFLPLVFDPDMLVDRSLVENLFTDRAFGVEGVFLVGRHEGGFVFQSDVTGQARAVHEDFAAVVALLWLLVMFSFLRKRIK